MALEAAPYPRPKFALSSREVSLPELSYSGYVFVGNQTMSVSFSQDWLPIAADLVWTAPDFEGLPGWGPALRLPARTPVQWQLSRYEYNDVASDYTPQVEYRGAYIYGFTGEYCGDGVVQVPYETCDPPDGATCNSDCFSVTP